MTMNKNLKHILRIMVEYLAIDMSAKLIRVINGKANETATSHGIMIGLKMRVEIKF